MTDNSKQRTIMFVAAHPADPFDAAAGTMALHAKAGDKVVVVSLSPAARSHAPTIYGGDVQPNLDDRKEQDLYAETVKIKKEEFKNACKAVGAEMVCFDYVDEPFMVTKEVINETAECFRKYRPDILVTHHVTEMNHHDHPLAGDVALRAAITASRWLEGSRREPYLIPKIYFYGTQFRPAAVAHHGAIPIPPTHIVDVESTMDEKIASLAAFKTQAYLGMGYDSKEYIETRVRGIEGHYGLTNGLKYAEVYTAYKPCIVNALD